MTSYSVGDIFTVNVRYEDDPSQVKRRPVVVIHVDENDAPVVALVSPITSVGPRKPPTYHDRYKVEIIDWAKAGLNKPSWVKSDKIFQVNDSSFKTYVGSMQEDDLFELLDRINSDAL